jgi:hypothetical protein
MGGGGEGEALAGGAAGGDAPGDDGICGGVEGVLEEDGAGKGAGGKQQHRERAPHVPMVAKCAGREEEGGGYFGCSEAKIPLS